MGNKKGMTADKLSKNKASNDSVVYKVMVALVLLCGGLMVLRNLRATYSTVGGIDTIDALIPWIILVGFVGCAVAVLAWVVCKNKIARMILPWFVAVFAMTGITGVSMKLFWTQGFSALYFLWVALMVQVVIFLMYGWEFFLFSLPTAAAGFLFLNFSTGFSMSIWNALVLVIAVVCLLVTFVLARTGAKNAGIVKFGKQKFLLFSSKFTPTLHYLVCGLWLVCIAASLLLGSLFSYYCMFAAVAVEFIAAVYYTFQLN